MEELIKAKNKSKICMSIDPDVLKELDEIAKEENRSRSSMIETILREHLIDRQ